MKCNHPDHPEHHGRECLCADCEVLNHCVHGPCSLCEGPVTECNPLESDEEDGEPVELVNIY